MKGLFFIVSVFTSLFSLCAASNDIIVFGEFKSGKVECNVQFIDNDTVAFSLPGDTTQLHKKALKNVQGIDFGTSCDILSISEIILDTLTCRINRITREEVFYIKSDDQLESMVKSKVFYCQFGYPEFNERLRHFTPLFKDILHARGTEHQSWLKRRNGEIYPVTNVSLGEEKIVFEIIREEMNLQTHLPLSEIASFENFTIKTTIPGASNFYSYILSRSGSFSTIYDLTITNKELVFSVNQNNNTTNTKYGKENIAGLFFTDFSDTNKVQSKIKQINNRSVNNAEINISGHYGRGFKRSSDYPDKSFSNGFGGSINPTLFIDPNNGVGLQYKFHIQQATSENNDPDGSVYRKSHTTNVFTVNYTYRLLTESLVAYELVAGGGLLILNGHKSFQDSKTSYRGLAPAFIFSNRFCILGNEAGIYLDVSLLVSPVGKYTYTNSDLTMDETINPSRIEIGLGFKLGNTK